MNKAREIILVANAAGRALEKSRLEKELSKLEYLRKRGVQTFEDEARISMIRRKLAILEWECENDAFELNFDSAKRGSRKMRTRVVPPPEFDMEFPG